MCGRYNILTDAQALVDFFEVSYSLADAGMFQPRYNIAASQNVPAIRRGAQGRELLELRWGLIPAWSKDPKAGYRMINARAETVSSKPAYRAAFRQRRCLIPATGFYEWKGPAGNKQPYCIAMKDGGLFAFAGLWEHWQNGEGGAIDSCTIIVTAANDLIRPIHDRMPVILDRQHYARWLDPGNRDIGTLESLLQPYDGQYMTAFRVNRRVNNPNYDDPGCIEREEAEDQDRQPGLPGC